MLVRTFDKVERALLAAILLSIMLFAHIAVLVPAPPHIDLTLDPAPVKNVYYSARAWAALRLQRAVEFGSFFKASDHAAKFRKAFARDPQFAMAALVSNYMFWFGNACTSAATTGNSSSAASWSGCGGGIPGAGDTATIRATDTITVDTNATWGSNGAGVGAAFTVQATNSSVFGRLLVATGVTLTVRGFDTTTNLLGVTNQFASFEPASGATVLADNASDMGSVFKFHGKVTSVANWSIPAANISWANASGNQVYSATAPSPYAIDPAGVGIYVHKLQISGNLDPGAISNSTNNGRCAFGDTSFVINSSTSWTNAVSSFLAISANGDYWLDCTTGALYWKQNGGTLTATYHFNYETHKSFGLIMEDNATGSTVSFTGGAISWCGSNGAAQGEHLGGCALLDDKYNCTIDATRCMTFNNVTFNDCVNAIQIYQDNTQGTASTLANPIVITGNSFIGCHYNTQTQWMTGAISIGNANYITVSGVGSTWNSFIPPFRSLMRGDVIGIKFQNNGTAAAPAKAILYTLLPLDSPFSSVGSSSVTSNNMQGFSGETDTRMVNTAGNSTNGRNTYDSNVLGYGHRVGGIVPYTTVTNNKFYRTYHHGVIPRANDEYVSNCTFTNNIVYDTNQTGATGGGFTSGYNHLLLIDGCIISHNTYDNGARGFRDNDEEIQVVLSVNMSFKDNIVSNSGQGLIDVTSTSTNIGYGAWDLFGYNDIYNNTTTTPAITQAMFTTPTGANYNTSTRNINGVKLWNATGYTLPSLTPRSLVEVISGTMGTSGSLTLQWAGGTVSSNLILAQGTGANVSGTTGSSGTFPTLTDATASKFSVAGAGLKGHQVYIISGSGAGQAGMIGSNTANVLTIVPYATNQKWAVAPTSSTVYVVVQSQTTLADGANSVYAGIRVPDLSFTPATNTDSNITLTTTSLAVNPAYVSQTDLNAVLRPTNAALAGAASDGTTIGALQFLKAAPILKGVAKTKGAVKIK